MNEMALRRQYNALWEILDSLECFLNEWNSVGMMPPKEDTDKCRSIARKVARIARQLKIND